MDFFETADRVFEPPLLRNAQKRDKKNRRKNENENENENEVSRTIFWLSSAFFF
jgi:hypothetical protein